MSSKPGARTSAVDTEPILNPQRAMARASRRQHMCAGEASRSPSSMVLQALTSWPPVVA
jgi:hypothetical protein